MERDSAAPLVQYTWCRPMCKMCMHIPWRAVECQIDPMTDRKKQLFYQLMVKGVETLTSINGHLRFSAHSTGTNDRLFDFHLFIFSTCKQQYLI